MGEGALRLILLGAGLLFLALLAWLGSRRPRRTREAGPPAARTEPRLGDEPAHAPLPAVEPMLPTPPAAAATPFLPAVEGTLAPGREPTADPPVVAWSEVRADDEAPAEAIDGVPPAHDPREIEELPVRQATEERRGPPRGSLAAAPAQAAPGAEPELVVAWPPESERYIASLRILPARTERLSGRLLRQGLAASGFRHGPFGIFHVGHDDGRVLVSAASLVRPGLLDPSSMDFHQYPGVSLFAVLPSALEPPALLERLANLAFELAGRVEGAVQDEAGTPMGPQEAPAWRARCIAAMAQREPAAGAP